MKRVFRSDTGGKFGLLAGETHDFGFLGSHVFTGPTQFSHQRLKLRGLGDDLRAKAFLCLSVSFDSDQLRLLFAQPAPGLLGLAQDDLGPSDGLVCVPQLGSLERQFGFQGLELAGRRQVALLALEVKVLSRG